MAARDQCMACVALLNEADLTEVGRLYGCWRSNVTAGGWNVVDVVAVTHGTQKLDQSIPAVIEAIQTGFDPCIIRQICKKKLGYATRGVPYISCYRIFQSRIFQSRIFSVPVAITNAFIAKVFFSGHSKTHVQWSACNNAVIMKCSFWSL